MDNTPSGAPEVRFIKRLVTVLTATMIAGLLVIIALFVIRFREPAPLALPETLDLPQGETAQAVTMMPERILIITKSGRILVYDRAGRLSQTITLDP